MIRSFGWASFLDTEPAVIMKPSPVDLHVEFAGWAITLNTIRFEVMIHGSQNPGNDG
jgi:hypothetical protein